MKLLSDLFLTWASAGQYGTVRDLDTVAGDSEAPATTVHAIKAGVRKKTVGFVPQVGSGGSEPRYIDGSMLVKRRLG